MRNTGTHSMPQDALDELWANWPCSTGHGPWTSDTLDGPLYCEMCGMWQEAAWDAEQEAPTKQGDTR
jgi:hypothetical protein